MPSCRTSLSAPDAFFVIVLGVVPADVESSETVSRGRESTVVSDVPVRRGQAA